MHKTAIFVCLVVTVWAAATERFAAAVDARTSARRQVEMNKARAEHARRTAELKSRSSGSHRGLPPVSPKSSAPERDFRGNPVGASGATTISRGARPAQATGADAEPQTPPFNPSLAPPPAEMLARFVVTAKSARSLDPLLPYLPTHEQQRLKSGQARYDPQEAAASRLRWKQRDPEVSEETLTFLTTSPYQRELDRLQGVAGYILDVTSVKIDGNKALVMVTTNNGAIVNSVRYGYGMAEITLVGEGSAWKFQSYEDLPFKYMELPR